jgi:preprotein translocase subunit SecE
MHAVLSAEWSLLVSTVKQENAAGGTFMADLLQTGIYKRSQGRISRQLTFAGVGLAVIVGCWRLAVTLETYDWLREWAKQVHWSPATVSSLIGFVVFLPLIWLCYRAVNIPRFADFLIAVEAEMNKVSWPTKQELIRASIVVLVAIFLLAAVLFAFDIVWIRLFQIIGIEGGAGAAGAG